MFSESYENAQELLLNIGRRMYSRGYVAANDGNLSLRLADSRFAVTVTGVSKGFLNNADVVIINDSGEVIEGSGKPTSELQMHLNIYARRADVCAICHAHPPYATAFASSSCGLPAPFLPEVLVNLAQEIPLVPYAAPGSRSLAEGVGTYSKRADALLLANHGAVTVGKDIEQAWFRMETLEHYAQISYLLESLGGAAPLSQGEIERLGK